MKILAICGSLRARSSNLAVLQAAQMLAPRSLEITLFDGLEALPHFNPDRDRIGIRKLHPHPCCGCARQSVTPMVCSYAALNMRAALPVS